MTTQSKEENGYHGYRYLVDASDDRQYAVRFENGKPRNPVSIFTADGKEGAFRGNETIFAFDDESEVRVNGGGLTLSTTLFQFKTGANGAPRSLKIAAVEYDIRVVANGIVTEFTFEMSRETEARLKDMGFDTGWPRKFADSQGPGDGGILTRGNIVQVDSTLMRSMPFPPHHEQGAFLARANIDAAEQPAAANDTSAATYRKADDQTLVETKTLGDGEKMKIIFNFEARRVTEVYEGPNGKAAMTGYAFADCDSEALESAHARLSGLKGKPRPLDEKKGPSLKTVK